MPKKMLHFVANILLFTLISYILKLNLDGCHGNNAVMCHASILWTVTQHKRSLNVWHCISITFFNHLLKKNVFIEIN